MLDLLFWSGADLLLKLTDLEDQFLSLLHLYLFLLFLFLQHPPPLLFFLIVNLTVLLQQFLLLHFDILFAFLDLFDQLFLILKFFSF